MIRQNNETFIFNEEFFLPYINKGLKHILPGRELKIDDIRTEATSNYKSSLDYMYDTVIELDIEKIKLPFKIQCQYVTDSSNKLVKLDIFFIQYTEYEKVITYRESDYSYEYDHDWADFYFHYNENLEYTGYTVFLIERRYEVFESDDPDESSENTDNFNLSLTGSLSGIDISVSITESRTGEKENRIVIDYIKNADIDRIKRMTAFSNCSHYMNEQLFKEIFNQPKNMSDLEQLKDLYTQFTTLDYNELMRRNTILEMLCK